MIILISGSSHTGKTNLAQKLLEKYRYPYLSIDHLKMGLIRNRNTLLTPNDDASLFPIFGILLRKLLKLRLKISKILLLRGAIFLLTGKMISAMNI